MDLKSMKGGASNILENKIDKLSKEITNRSIEISRLITDDNIRR